MRHDNTEDQSARTASSRFSTSEFDTTLPPDVRAELLRPKRRQTPPPRRWAFLPWACGFAAVALVWAAIDELSSRTETTARPQSVAPPIVAPTPAVPVPAMQPTPAAIQPGWHADGTAYGRAGTIGGNQPAPKAVLVKMPQPTPRAQLVHLRAIGTYENALMPDGRILGIQYKGELDSAADLPKNGAQIGDMWYTRNDGHAWVLAPIAAGSQAIGWLDP